MGNPGHLAVGGDIPHSRRLVPTASDHILAIRTEPHGSDNPLKGNPGHLAVGGNIPHSRRIVLTPSGHILTIRTEPHV